MSRWGLSPLPWRRGLRALRIWRSVLTLLFFLWWDSCSWTYPGDVSDERRQIRQQRRARWLTRELV